MTPQQAADAAYMSVRAAADFTRLIRENSDLRRRLAAAEAERDLWRTRAEGK